MRPPHQLCKPPAGRFESGFVSGVVAPAAINKHLERNASHRDPAHELVGRGEKPDALVPNVDLPNERE